ncbi:TKL protein kinase [Saprolegnia diclina VS20]|uniref:TKL protein kinase n=1 Tax=Saprolegnia diclina (strain VS20) TaxID=1156394 RepID=T0S519_SAPDV|nr:TKL protein kinase [Saprolegnia diclina VS20]EQC40218.1 TKL protein kinase [Saprolegnia diclina VS20]|eukprot:XP_008606692.1 TKL protein kinase [Saprolegnia diclina VS20]
MPSLTDAERAAFEAIELGDYVGVARFLATSNVHVADPDKKSSQYTYTLVHAALHAVAAGCRAIEARTELSQATLALEIRALHDQQRGILELLLRFGFDVTQACNQDLLSLPTVAMRLVGPPYTVAFLQVLLNPNLTKSGITPHMWDLVPAQPCVFEAVQRDNVAALEFFMAQGVDPTTTNKMGECLLFKAVQRRSMATVELLLHQSRINVNQTTTMGDESPLLAAVRLRALDIVELLLGNGADKELPDRNKNTPLMIALRRDYTDIAMALETRSILDVHYDDKVVVFHDYCIGSGSRSIVFRGSFNGRYVAVKESRRVYDVSMWIELQLYLTRLRSEHIVKLLHIDFNQKERRVALVLELMAMNLCELLGQEAKLSLAQKVRIALDVVQGVASLHEKKILHCNLKSRNVLIDDNGRAKVGGFACSTSQQSASDADEYQGTLWYMAPELLTYPPAAPSEASDVYAFGILLTELDANTGEVPYGNVGYESPFALPNQVRSGLRPALQDDCPPWFRELAVQCMAEVPSDRPNVSTIIDTLKKKLCDI